MSLANGSNETPEYGLFCFEKIGRAVKWRKNQEVKRNTMIGII